MKRWLRGHLFLKAREFACGVYWVELQICPFFSSKESLKFCNIVKKSGLTSTRSLDLVHPCYNPHTGWAEDLLHYFLEFKKQLPADQPVSVYLVNDGSSQGIQASDLALLKQGIGSFYYIDSVSYTHLTLPTKRIV